MRFICTFICLGFFLINATAQDYTFKVLISKGQNEVRPGGGTWHALKIGETLRENSEVRIPENSYVALVHVSGKPLEVKDAGSYSVADLTSKIGAGASVVSKYTDFILSSNEEKKNRLAATGAVHRDPPSPISLYLPGPGIDHVYSDRITITWAEGRNQAPYRVEFKNLYGDELLTLKTEATSIHVNLDSAGLKGEESILVTVVSEPRGRTSLQRSIKKLPANVKQDVGKILSDFGDVADSETALNKYILAGFFEEHGLIIDAISNYYEASVMAPEIEDYQTAYIQFLERLQLKK